MTADVRWIFGVQNEQHEDRRRQGIGVHTVLDYFGTLCPFSALQDHSSIVKTQGGPRSCTIIDRLRTSHWSHPVARALVIHRMIKVRNAAFMGTAKTKNEGLVRATSALGVRYAVIPGAEFALVNVYFLELPAIDRQRVLCLAPRKWEERLESSIRMVSVLPSSAPRPATAAHAESALSSCSYALESYELEEMVAAVDPVLQHRFKQHLNDLYAYVLRFLSFLGGGPPQAEEKGDRLSGGQTQGQDGAHFPHRRGSRGGAARLRTDADAEGSEAVDVNPGDSIQKYQGNQTAVSRTTTDNNVQQAVLAIKQNFNFTPMANQALIWALAKELCLKKHPDWPELALGAVLGCGLATFKDEKGRTSPGTSRHYRILISTSVFQLWKIRNESLFEKEGNPLPEVAIHNKWLFAINQLATYGKQNSIKLSLVLQTRTSTLLNEEELPENCVKKPGVIVGIGPKSSHPPPLSPRAGGGRIARPKPHTVAIRIVLKRISSGGGVSHRVGQFSCLILSDLVRHRTSPDKPKKNASPQDQDPG
ncbi:hypothetical protein B0H19DRAFT_1078929 [Mycena capillaripes]|nr:hypothetical protein B0H19DRAFT_1078929 [Mycena capillaripes]